MASLELAVWGSYADLKAEVVYLWGYGEGGKETAGQFFSKIGPELSTHLVWVSRSIAPTEDLFFSY